MSRSDVGRQYQIGVETTPGTAVAANKLLTALSFNLNYEADVKNYRAQGNNFNTNSVLNRSWMTGSYEGPFNFNEIVYPLSSLFGAATITTPSGGTNARNWAFLPKQRGASVLKTFTVEEGDETAAEIFAYVVARSLSFSFGADEITVSGDLLGRTGTSGSLTASPTALAQIIASANQIDVYMADAGDLANLFTSGNKVADAIEETFSIGEKVDPRFVHNTSFQSYKDVVEKAPELTFSFTTEHNAQSRTLKAAAQSNVFKYMGLMITGPIIEGSIPYSLKLTVAARVTPNQREDAGGVWGYSYNANPIYDPTLGGTFKIEVVNSISAL